jgi:gamma-glutamyltranspeptidase / glutathione hydrolase
VLGGTDGPGPRDAGSSWSPACQRLVGGRPATGCDAPLPFGATDLEDERLQIGGRARGWVSAAALMALLFAVGCDADDDPPAAAPAEPEEPGSPDQPAPEEPPEDAPEPEAGNQDGYDPEADVPPAHGVSAGHPAAVDAGMMILEQGGTAADAAVAAAFASGVAEPFTSGLGGGGAALVLEQDGDPRAYDYREVVADDGAIPASNTGVPGFVAGMERLRVEHGALPLAELLGPAIELAEGTTVSELVAERLAGDAGALPVPQLPHLYPDGAPLSAGDQLVQAELADTLRTIAEHGAEVFYEGDIAETLASAVEGLDASSLAGYEVQSTPPPAGRVGDLEVIGAAPPLPGTSLIQQLQIAEAMGIAELEPNSADAVHILASAWRVALAHQEWDLGDPAFVDVPVDELVDPDRNAALASDLDLASLPPVDPDQPRGGIAPNTTHITVVDDAGTMVSMTNTITNFWGSRQYVAGFFLNDHLRRFDHGRGEANQPEAGKRPVTWSLPVIVADREGRPVLGLGSPGGVRIPNVLASAITRWGLQGQVLGEVVEGPRFHVEGTALEVEEGLAGLGADLRSRGWSEVTQPASRLHFGSIQALEIDYEQGELRGATDARREADHRIEASP